MSERSKFEQSYIGLEKRAAQNKAERDNMIFRLVSVNGEKMFGPPEDQRTDRICCIIQDNRVEDAYVQ